MKFSGRRVISAKVLSDKTLHLLLKEQKAKARAIQGFSSN
jgi:hypothetical protein